MNAREAILAGIRAARGDVRDDGPAVAHIRPAVGEDLAGRFAERLAARAATVARLDSLHQVGGAVAAWLAGHGLPTRLAAAPVLREIAWPAELDIHFGAARRDEATAVTSAFAAIAENGTLVLLSGSRTPTTLNFVPENHLVLVTADRLVRHPEDVWARLRSRPGGMPRTVNLIAGPSRTADVEQTIQLGAHGPRRLHVLLVGGDDQEAT